MKLFYNPVSTYSRKALLAFYEKGVEFDGEIINLLDPEARAAYKNDHNPFGKVPMLKLADGYPIPESSIIIEYIDTHFEGNCRLIPEDPNLARRARFFDRIGDLYFINPSTTVFFERMKPADEQNAELLGRQLEIIDSSLKLTEQHLDDGKKFMLGDELSMGDLGISAALFYIRMGHSFDDYPKTNGFLNRMLERDSWKRVNRESEPFMAAFTNS